MLMLPAVLGLWVVILVDAGLLGVGIQESDSAEKLQHVRFFREFWEITLVLVSGRGYGSVFLHSGQMMMLEGGSCMIILLLGLLFKTGWGLADSQWGWHGPTPQVCMLRICRCMSLMWSGHTQTSYSVRNNNNNTIWGGSVSTGEEPPRHSEELNHALSQVGGPTQSQLSRTMPSGHHISMEHRLQRKHLEAANTWKNEERQSTAPTTEDTSKVKL